MIKEQLQGSTSDLASEKHDVGRAPVTRWLVTSVEMTLLCYLVAISFDKTWIRVYPLPITPGLFCTWDIVFFYRIPAYGPEDI
jgi:hypothetical protein